MNSLLAAVLAYLVLQFAIGLWVSRRIRNEDDYLVAGRRLGYPLATFSIFATWFGAETCLGSAGQAYREGLTASSAEPFGYGVCLLLMGFLLAVPLWRRKLTTMADFFRQRYSVSVERLAAIIYIPGSVLWAAAQMRAFGHVLATTTPIDVQLAVTIAAGFCVIYTAFGGLLADAYTDLIQGLVLVAGLLVAGAVVVQELGGPGASMIAFRESERFFPEAAAGAGLLATLEAWAIPIGGSVIAAELVSRIIAARTPEVARRSSLLAGVLYLMVGFIPVFIGVTAAQIIGDPGDPEQILPVVARELLPTAAYALFAGALISAILSTVDSTLLVASGMLSHNLIIPLLPDVSERGRVRLARAGVLVFGIIAYFLALGSEGVYALVEEASAFGGAGVVVTVCFGLFTRWGGWRTALATLAAGMIAYVAGSASGAAYPFIGSVAISLGVYAGGAVLERESPLAE